MSVALDQVLVAFNGTEACRTAVRRAASLARRGSGVLDLVTVGVPVVPVGGFGWVAPYDETHYLSTLLERRVEEGAALAGPGVEVRRHAVLGSPAPEIVKVAEQSGADLIVLGAAQHSRLERIFLGSVVDRVVRLSPVPCLVARTPECARRLLVAVDESPFGERALLASAALAPRTGAEIRCVHVVADPPADTGVDPASSPELEAVAARFREFVAGVLGSSAPGGGPAPTTVIRTGKPLEEILTEAREWAADLLVAGSHGRGFFARAVLGSVSEALLRECPVSILVAPGPAE